MNVDARLRQLIEAERATSTPMRTSVQGWERLASAVTAGVPAVPVPSTTIALASVSIIAKGGAVAVVVGAIGTAAIVGTSPHHSSAVSSPTSSAMSQTKRVAPSLARSQELVLDAGAPGVTAQRAQPTSSRTLLNKGLEEPSASAAPPSSLDDELQLISRAKHELDRGQAHLAQVWLDEHRARFPTGTLSAERDGLLVLMACGNANSSDGVTRAQDYALKYPGSPLLDRIYRACQAKGSPDEISK